MGVESYKHQFAKTVLADWLRSAAKSAGRDEYAQLGTISWRVNRSAPHYGVWVEYPVCLTKENQLIGVDYVWDEYDDEFIDAPPTYARCIEMGLLPICIFDVAVQHKGLISSVFEVVHKNGISPTKAGYLNRVFQEQRFGLHILNADWILSQVGPPKHLNFTFTTQSLSGVTP